MGLVLLGAPKETTKLSNATSLNSIHTLNDWKKILVNVFATNTAILFLEIVGLQTVEPRANNRVAPMDAQESLLLVICRLG